MNKNYFCGVVGFVFLLCSFAFVSCAGNRQGVVCDEIEYRLNTMTYSPDQRAYAEEELRVCREEEAKKRGEDAATRQSIYDRFAASDSTGKKNADGSADTTPEVSVSEALQDSSGEKTTSIYDRYGAVDGSASAENVPATETSTGNDSSVTAPESPALEPAPAADTSASDVSNFQ